MPVIRHIRNKINEGNKTCKSCGGITIYKSDEPFRLNFLTNGYCDQCIKDEDWRIKNLKNERSNI